MPLNSIVFPCGWYCLFVSAENPHLADGGFEAVAQVHNTSTCTFYLRAPVYLHNIQYDTTLEP
jgi:hypothetical protein